MKITKILMSLLFALSLIFGTMQIASADEPAVTLRIEGINENIYYGAVHIGDSKTVADIIVSADVMDDDLSVIGAESGYITDINGESAATFGGWDGWMYRVNNTEPSVGMNEYEIKAGDKIVVYYSDSFGVGMQYPAMDVSELSNGIITFTSMDTTYDENYNAMVCENPVVDMVVIFDESEYITDKNGMITIDKSLLTSGDHKISISKYSENGIPLVLRLPPDITVNVPASTPDESIDKTPQTGDNEMMVLFMLVSLVSAFGCVMISKSRK